MASISPPHADLPASQSPRTLPAKRSLGATTEEADSENRRKDPKISRACDTCKRKKIRCSGTLPCSNCARRKVECAYDAKYCRGRPPTPGPSGTVEESHERAGSHGSNVVTEYHHETPECEPVLAPQTYSRASPENENEGQYSDPTSGLNFLHRAWQKLLAHKDDSASNRSSNAERNQPLTSAGDRPFHIDSGEPDNCFPDDSRARMLQEFYFETCVVTYRMFHRQTVEGWMEVFLTARQEGRPLTEPLGKSKSAILFCIMAIATLRHEKVSGCPSAKDDLHVLRRSDMLFSAGARLTDTEMGFPRLESAQARLIKVLYLLQSGRMNKGWYTFGSAFHITLSLGMHKQRDQKRDSFFTSRRQNYITEECYKRTFWTAYTIDRYLSVVFGRPRLYQDEDINQSFPDSVNDEDMTPQGPSIMEEPNDCFIDGLVFHAKIARVIGKVSREVYSGSNLSDQDRWAVARQLAREVHEWHASLPPHLGTVKPSTLIPSFRRQAIAMQLAYSHALIHVNRLFLFSDLTSDGATECLFAAKTSLEIVNRMARDKTILHSFWWTHYVIFCALAVIYVWQIQQATRPSQAIDDESLDRIFELANQSHSHLRHATTGISQNERYSIILDELRSEAQRCRAARNPWNPAQGDLSTSENHVTTNAGFPFLQGPDVFGSGSEAILPEGIMPNISEGLLFSDWQTLDSSAFFPLPDPNSVSPTCFSTVP